MALSSDEYKLIEEKFRARDLALEVAVRTLDKRLESMNEFREALRDQAANFATRDVFDTMNVSVTQLRVELSRYVSRVEELDKAAIVDRAQLDRRLEAMNEFRAQLKDQAAGFYTRAEHQAFQTDIESRLATNWPLLVSFVSILLVLLAGGWGLMGLKVDAASGPLVIGVEQLRTGLGGLMARTSALETTTTQHTSAVGEINLMKRNYEMMADRLATVRTDVAKQQAALTEIETQFCASDTVRNLMHAHDLRIQAMMWVKIMDEKLPTDNAFYPIICHGTASKQ